MTNNILNVNLLALQWILVGVTQTRF